MKDLSSLVPHLTSLRLAGESHGETDLETANGWPTSLLLVTLFYNLFLRIYNVTKKRLRDQNKGNGTILPSQPLGLVHWQHLESFASFHHSCITWKGIEEGKGRRDGGHMG